MKLILDRIKNNLAWENLSKDKDVLELLRKFLWEYFNVLNIDLLRPHQSNFTHGRLQVNWFASTDLEKKGLNRVKN